MRCEMYPSSLVESHGAGGIYSEELGAAAPLSEVPYLRIHQPLYPLPILETLDIVIIVVGHVY